MFDHLNFRLVPFLGVDRRWFDVPLLHKEFVVLVLVPVRRQLWEEILHDVFKRVFLEIISDVLIFNPELLGHVTNQNMLIK